MQVAVGRLSGGSGKGIQELELAFDQQAVLHLLAPGRGPRAPVLDAPHGEGWLLDALGDDFVLLARGWRGAVPAGVRLVAVEGLVL